MIKLEIIAGYYKKNTWNHDSSIIKKTFYEMEEAAREFEKMIPKYYINKKDISIIETITLTYNTDFGIKRYYKKIDPITETIETNYKKED